MPDIKTKLLSMSTFLYNKIPPNLNLRVAPSSRFDMSQERRCTGYRNCICLKRIMNVDCPWAALLQTFYYSIHTHFEPDCCLHKNGKCPKVCMCLENKFSYKRNDLQSQ